jgi:hypothetical protein
MDEQLEELLREIREHMAAAWLEWERFGRDQEEQRLRAKFEDIARRGEWQEFE